MSGNNPQPAGSPIPDEPAFSAIGRVRRPHGVRGEVLVELLTDFPEHLDRGVIVFAGEDHQPLMIRSTRVHKDSLLLTFEGIDNPEQAGRFRNEFLYSLARERLPLPEGEYYHDELIGLNVVTEEGERLGQVTEILETGANDVFVVRHPGGDEILLPAISEVVLDVDLHKAEMRIHLIPGMLDEE